MPLGRYFCSKELTIIGSCLFFLDDKAPVSFLLWKRGDWGDLSRGMIKNPPKSPFSKVGLKGNRFFYEPLPKALRH